MRKSYAPLDRHPATAPLGYGENFTGSTAAPSTDFIASAMDELACPVIIVDRHGHLLHSNLAADALLQRSDCVVLLEGKVTVTHKPDELRFNEALLSAAVGKRSMLALGNVAHTTVAIVPLRNTSGQASEPRFALMFSRAEVSENLMLSFFSRCYRLTASEARVLGLIYACLTAPEMALHLSVGQATIRTHLRSIFNKTNSKSVRDIVKRLATLPPLMTTVMPSTVSPLQYH